MKRVKRPKVIVEPSENEDIVSVIDKPFCHSIEGTLWVSKDDIDSFVHTVYIFVQVLAAKWTFVDIGSGNRMFDPSDEVVIAKMLDKMVPFRGKITLTA